MVKGWRNDPRWVEIYERRDRERIERAIARMKAEHQLQMTRADADRAVAQLQRPRFGIGY